MFSRILSLLICLMPVGWGWWALTQGLRIDASGPVIGGAFFIFTGLLFILCIFFDWFHEVKQQLRCNRHKSKD